MDGLMDCHNCRYFLEHEVGCLLYQNPYMAKEQLQAGLAGECDEGKPLAALEEE